MKFTRREFGALTMGAVAGGLASRTAKAAAASAPALPAGAIDCHIHIVGPQSKYPMVANRAYTPPEATVADLRALRSEIGVPRQVIVTPSFYGVDNSCTLDAIAELGPSARGVAVVPLGVTDAELQRLDRAGFVGARMNFATASVTDPYRIAAELLTLAGKIRPFRWHLQINTELNVINTLIPILGTLPLPVVFDHIGNPDAALGVGQPGFAGLVRVVELGAFVKLSAPYNHSKLPDYADVAPLAKALIAMRPDRMLWGTNWPHPAAVRAPVVTEISPYQVIDNANLVRLFQEWCPDPAMQKMILVDTPTRLYRFA